MARNEAYQEAEKKIEAARRSGAKELDLSVPWTINKEPKLTELPESLGQLTQLEKLNLTNNQLTALPEWLGQLTQLETLNLSNNQLAALPESLGQLKQLQSLDVGHNQLRALPESLCQFRQLQSLDLPYNQFKALPESLGLLTQLETLNLSNNQLMALPESLARLTKLKSLFLSQVKLVKHPANLSHLVNLREIDLSFQSLTEIPKWLLEVPCLEHLYVHLNLIRSLPDWFSKLTHLTDFSIGGNPIGRIPSILRELNLERLNLWDCGLSGLPDWIGELSELKCLNLHSSRRDFDTEPNILVDIPNGVLELQNLEQLDLSGNPLNPALAAAHKEGLDAVKRYLREMAKGARKRYEAKLLILGDGNEGKTCVSRALRGLPFRKQVSTRGVDVVPWKVKHPEDETDQSKDITLNIWDFEGQEISHQTHQFFLTSQALYLLVFKCRDLFLMDRAEYWLDTIRARAPMAKVVIVISQCEERSPHLPLDRLQAQYADMLAEQWFFPVGCENGKNIEKLQDFLRRSAVKLEFMGAPWPQTYERAESALKAKAKTKAAHLPRAKLNAILKKAGVSPDNYDGAASAMERIGAITQFLDCPDLSNFVVIKPQWLTKAISIVMENGKLSEDKGEIELKRMEAIWNSAHYEGMFSTFHNCMKEFELCYDLEDHSQCCLVPLRFGYVPPPIPWTSGEGIKVRRMEYKLNIRPPMGIMSRFIVKTHHMIVKNPAHPKGIYWHNGVFLRTHSPVPSEALCEFVPDERLLRVEVRAAFPQMMCEQIHAYIQAVFSFFGGLSAERSFGCIKVDENGHEHRCQGLFPERRIYAALLNDRDTIDCDRDYHPVDPRLLIGGFSSFSDFLARELMTKMRMEMDKTPAWAKPFVRDITTLLHWADVHADKLYGLLKGQEKLSDEFKQQAEQKLHEYLSQMSELLNDREATAAPGIISICTKDRSAWNPTSYFKKTYLLTPYCESADGLHPWTEGSVEFTRDRAWWQKTAPWIARATNLLSAGLQIGIAGMPLAMGADVAKEFESELKFMSALGKHLDLEVPEANHDNSSKDIFREESVRDLRGQNEDELLARAALARLLDETAPDNYRAKTWGGLRRVRMPDNSHRWLCGCCAEKVR